MLHIPITLSEYRFTLSPFETLELPAYEGSTLRGAFGTALRRTVCMQRNRRDCTGCALERTCAFAYLFASSPPPDATLFQSYVETPRPYVLEPPNGGGTYVAGAPLHFRLTLVGHADLFFPYCLLAFHKMSQIGLGRRRTKLHLEKVEVLGEDLKWHVVYEAGDTALAEHRHTIDDDIFRQLARVILPPTPVDSNGAVDLTLRFDTPTRLKVDGRLRDVPRFAYLLRALLRRLSMLAACHCEAVMKLDFEGLLQRGHEVEVVEDRTSWVDWSRYSRRQGRWMKLGGITGEVTYRMEHDFLQFILPALVAGQFLHIGKNTTFGLGKYTLLPVRSGASAEGPKAREGVSQC